MTRSEMELKHMTMFLSESPTSFRAWKQYFLNKAQAMAKDDPAEFWNLPEMLGEEISRLRSSLSQPKQPELVTHSGSPARGLSQATKVSTSRRSLSSKEGK